MLNYILTKLFGEKQDSDSSTLGQACMLSKKIEPKPHPYKIVDSIEEKRLFESRRGKVSFK